MKSVEAAVKWAEKIAADNSHGYDQTKRNGPDYDCSSFVATAFAEGGFPISPKCWTGNLYEALTSVGFKQVSGGRLRGDVLLTPGKHVVLCVDSNRIVHASKNEKGGITGGKTGDQTGNEICVRAYYTPSYGWTYHLRYTNAAIIEKKPTLINVAYGVLRGDYGNFPGRKEAVEATGYPYDVVQEFVNYICKYNDDYVDVVGWVIAGDYGNGDARREALEEEGWNADEIQWGVNQVLEYG